MKLFAGSRAPIALYNGIPVIYLFRFSRFPLSDAWKLKCSFMRVYSILHLLLLRSLVTQRSSISSLHIWVSPLHATRITHTSDLGQVPGQPFHTIFMLSMSTMNLLQRISHQEFIIGSREDGRGNIDKYGDPRIAVIEGESLLSEEDSCHDSGS